MGFNILNLTSFAFILTYICMCGSGSVFRIRTRIQEAPEYGSNTAPEYGSNTDPDPQHCKSHSNLCTEHIIQPIRYLLKPCYSCKLNLFLPDLLGYYISDLTEPVSQDLAGLKSVLWIRIRKDPELLPGSGIKVPDPIPAKSERAYK